MMQREEEIQKAAEYVEAIPRFSREKHSMEKLRRMLELLKVQPGDCGIIHVAGTNGKGSVCAFLSSILRKAGFRTAVFTSPHLLSIKERFVLDGIEADDELFIRAFEEVKDMSAAFAGEIGHPTYFEFLFLMFMVMVRETKPEYIVLETGMGGRLDATNCLERVTLSVITSISLDHMQYLGDTAEKIAAEKAGIIKKGIPVIFDCSNEQAAGVIRKRAASLGCRVVPAAKKECRNLMQEAAGYSFSVSPLLPEGEGKNDWTVKVPFEAEYQAVNALLALRAAEILGMPENAVTDGIAGAVWPGRMERISGGIYLDGAHNEGGIREFVRAARAVMARRRQEGFCGRSILLFSVVSDKEYQEMAGILCRELRPDMTVLTRLESGRGLDVQSLRKAVSSGDIQENIRIAPGVSQALRIVLDEKKEEDTVFCVGSLYLIGEIKKCLRRNKNE